MTSNVNRVVLKNIHQSNGKPLRLRLSFMYSYIRVVRSSAYGFVLDFTIDAPSKSGRIIYFRIGAAHSSSKSFITSGSAE